MNITDTHCDTLCKLTDKNLSFADNNLHISISKLKPEHQYTQFFACFADEEFKYDEMGRCRKLIGTFYDKIVSEEQVKFCTNYRELLQGQKENKMCAFLSVEGGGGIKSILDLEYYYKRGVRMVGLVWNNDNALASGINGWGGVTELGKEIIKKMNELSIILDVSHMNDKSFFEAIELTELPPVASHSCSRAICKNLRNLTDEQFKVIKEKGGYVGINYYPLFLSGNKNAGVEDIIRHMEHFLDIGGEDIIGIGSDFDGINILPEGLNSVGDIDILITAMKRLGWSDCLVEKIMSKNIGNIIKKI